MSRVALTYQDYAALPDDGRRYQILDGELCVTPAPGSRHQIISANLFAAIYNHVSARGLGLTLHAPTDVVLSDAPEDTSIVQPDILFLAAAHLARVSPRGIEGPPTLAVEILSPSTTDLDRRRKRELYARRGVPYYWIVDGDARTIEMYRLAGGAYELTGRESGDPMAAAEPFPGLVLSGVWR